MSDLNVNASIKLDEKFGVVLALSDGKFTDCSYKARSSDIVFKITDAKTKELLPNWPSGAKENQDFVKGKAERDKGYLVKLSPEIVQAILQSNQDRFTLMLKTFNGPLELECFKRGPISQEKALGNTQFEFVDTKGQDLQEKPYTNDTKTHDTITKVDSLSDASYKDFDPTQLKIEPKKKSSIPIGAIIGGVIALLALLGVIAYFLLQGTNSNDATKAQLQEQSQDKDNTKDDALDDNKTLNTTDNTNTQNIVSKCALTDTSAKAITTCAKDGSKDEVNAFIEHNIDANQCEIAVKVLLYRARHDSHDPYFAQKLSEYYDSKSNVSLPCLKKDDSAAMYYLDVANKIKNK